MNKNESLTKARLNREPKCVFENKEYSITKIPHNLQVYIKLPKKSAFKTINRYYYPFPEHGIMGAHETAKDMINLYFKH